MSSNSRQKPQPVRNPNYLPKAGPKSNSGGKNRGGDAKDASHLANTLGKGDQPSLMQVMRHATYRNEQQQKLRAELQAAKEAAMPKSFGELVFERAKKALQTRRTKDNWSQAEYDAGIRYLKFLTGMPGAPRSRSIATKKLDRAKQKNVEYYFTHTYWCKREHDLCLDNHQELPGATNPNGIGWPRWFANLYQSFFDKQEVVTA